MILIAFYKCCLLILLFTVLHKAVLLTSLSDITCTVINCLKDEKNNLSLQFYNQVLVTYTSQQVNVVI